MSKSRSPHAVESAHVAGCVEADAADGKKHPDADSIGSIEHALGGQVHGIKRIGIRLPQIDEPNLHAANHYCGIAFDQVIVLPLERLAHEKATRVSHPTPSWWKRWIQRSLAWHMDPDEVRLTEIAIEACDGLPSFVEKNLDAFVRPEVGYCPWSARIVGEK
jgi:hypothetical protein